VIGHLGETLPFMLPRLERALPTQLTNLDRPMLALAAMAAGGAALARRTRLLPAWLGWLGAVLAVALVVSGIGYLLLRSGLAPAAFVSGPLLLVWVTAVGLWLGRAYR
jgi:hypothetical protein